MPWKSKPHKPSGGRTEAQRKAEFQRRRSDQDRQKFYRSAAWSRMRRRILREHPTCVECEKLGRVVAATVVDHVVEVRDDDSLKLAPSNLRSLCIACHNAKTARTVNARRA